MSKEKQVLEKLEAIKEQGQDLLDQAKDNINKHFPKAEEVWHKHKVLISLLVIVSLFLITIPLYPRQTSLDLNDYLQIDYMGYDGSGMALQSVDIDRMMRDNKKPLLRQLERSAGKEQTNQDQQVTEWIYDLYNRAVDSTLHPSDELANGDEITLSWDIDDELAKDYGVSFKYKDETFTVTELDQVTEIDPFDGLVIDYSGGSPFLTAEVNFPNWPDQLPRLSYTIEDNGQLANGDEIKITLGSQDKELDADQWADSGYLLTQTSQTFTIDEQPELITDFNQLPEEARILIEEQAKDMFIANHSSRWKQDLELEQLDYAGAYLQVTKHNTQEPKTRYLMILKYTASIETKDKTTEKVEGYVPYALTNLILDQGEVTIDLENIWSSPPSFQYHPKKDSPSFSYSMPGYPTTDDLFKEKILNSVDQYTYEVSDELNEGS